MNELHTLLDQATDRIESPRLEQIALRTARQRRLRRRGTATAAVASVLVVAVVVGTQTGDRGSSQPADSPSSQTPTTIPTTDAPKSSGKVWPEWDPRKVDQLPAASDRIAPAIPDVIEPPASSPLLSDDPVAAAVLAVQDEGRAQVLGIDGRWRTIPLDGRYPRVSLSPDGARFAIHYGYDAKVPEHDYGVTIHTLATGDTRHLPPPEGFEPWDNTGWSFLDEDSLWFTSHNTSYDIGIDSGEVVEMTLPDGLSRTTDPEGNVLVSAQFDQPNVLTDYAGGSPREVSMDQTGRLSRIQANDDTVVGTTYDDQPFNVVVADRETLTPQFRLPVLDYDGNYSNGGLGPVALADDGTVLLHVAVFGRGVTGSRLVAWDPTDNDLAIVSSTALPVESTVVFAQSMLREVGS